MGAAGEEAAEAGARMAPISPLAVSVLTLTFSEQARNAAVSKF